MCCIQKNFLGWPKAHWPQIFVSSVNSIQITSGFRPTVSSFLVLAARTRSRANVHLPFAKPRLWIVAPTYQFQALPYLLASSCPSRTRETVSLCFGRHQFLLTVCDTPLQPFVPRELLKLVLQYLRNDYLEEETTEAG